MLRVLKKQVAVLTGIRQEHLDCEHFDDEIPGQHRKQDFLTVNSMRRASPVSEATREFVGRIWASVQQTKTVDFRLGHCFESSNDLARAHVQDRVFYKKPRKADPEIELALLDADTKAV